MADFLEGTADVPGVGKIKKRYIVIPAGLAGVYVAWRWYQAKQDTSNTDTTASGLYSSDDLSDYGLSTTGGSTSTTGNTGSTVTDATGDAISDNAKWTNKAIELLTNQGYDGAVVAAALGDFLARRALNKSEATIARAALAVAGQPPVNGPFPVIEEAGTSTGTLAAPKNLKAWGSATTTQVGMQWDAVPGALHYRIFRSDQGEEPMGDSFDTKFNARGLLPHHGYTFYVRAVGTTNKLGAKSSPITLKTADIKLGRPTGLRASAITKTSFRVSCGEVKGAQYYRWYINGAPSGASDDPYRDFTSRRPNTAYKITVAADTTSQIPGPVSAPLTVKTKK